jgi:uncharacterized protein with HEPN domain
MSDRSDALLMGDVSDAITRILDYTKDMLEEEFLTDIKTQDAVSRNFEVIGEASARLSAELKNKYSSTEWVKLKNFRNKIIHDYFGTDYRLVWSIIQKQLPTLKVEVESIIKSEFI